MNCPKCGALSKVIDTRLHDSGGIRRRRSCLECGYRWMTLELDYNAVRITAQIAKIFAQARPRGRGPVRNPNQPRLHRSGYVVPPELEADWLLLKRNHYRDDDAAEALGLKKEARE